MEYRKGAIGAMTDEYEKALNELKFVLESVSNEVFNTTIESNDDNCKSIKKITYHIINSGYVYCNYIRNRFGNEYINQEIKFDSVRDAISELDKMFLYNVATFEDKWHYTDEVLMNTIIKTKWTTYDLEAIIEHSIVHILRHRLQIQKIVQKIK